MQLWQRAARVFQITPDILLLLEIPERARPERYTLSRSLSHVVAPRDMWWERSFPSICDGTLSCKIVPYLNATNMDIAAALVAMGAKQFLFFPSHQHRVGGCGHC